MTEIKALHGFAGRTRPSDVSLPKTGITKSLNASDYRYQSLFPMEQPTA